MWKQIFWISDRANEMKLELENLTARIGQIAYSFRCSACKRDRVVFQESAASVKKKPRFDSVTQLFDETFSIPNSTNYYWVHFNLDKISSASAKPRNSLLIEEIFVSGYSNVNGVRSTRLIQYISVRGSVGFRAVSSEKQFVEVLERERETTEAVSMWWRGENRTMMEKHCAVWFSQLQPGNQPTALYVLTSDLPPQPLFPTLSVTLTPSRRHEAFHHARYIYNQLGMLLVCFYWIGGLESHSGAHSRNIHSFLFSLVLYVLYHFVFVNIYIHG